MGGFLMATIMFGCVPTPVCAGATFELSARTQREYRFDVSSATSLSAALEHFAKRTGLQLARFSDDVSTDIVVGPLSGTYTREDALQRLLQGTGLTYRVINASTVAIVKAPDTDSTTSRADVNTKKPNGLWARMAGLLALCGVLGPVGPACAQETSANTNANSLEEVVVTAERRATSAQTTAISMTVTTGDQLAERQQNTIADMQVTTPNLSVNAGNANNVNISIRGIGSTPGSASAAISPGVQVVRDGLLNPETIGQGLSLPFYDIHDVEILKGPQGTFVGTSSTGGSIQINSRNPTFDQGLSGYVEGLWGSYSDVKLDGAVNLPVTDTLAARVAFNSQQRNSFFYNVGANTAPQASHKTITDPGSVDNRNLRVGILWKPSEAFQALFKTSYNTSFTPGDPTQPNQGTFTNQVTGAISHSPYYASSTHQPYVLNPDIANQQDYVGLRTYGLELTYTLPNEIVLRSLTGYQRSFSHSYRDPDSSPVRSGITAGNIDPDIYYSEEINLISPVTWRVNFLAGASLFYRESPSITYAETWTPPYSPASPRIRQQTFAPIFTVARPHGVFAQVNYELTDTLQLQVGARENWDNTFNRGGTWTYVPNPAGTIFFPQVPGVAYGDPTFVSSKAAFKDSVPTGKAGVNWKPNADQFFYAFFARGYRAGGVSTVGTTFVHENLNDYELGWKSRMFDGHVQAQVDGFYMDLQRMQQQIFSTTGAGTYIANLSGPTTIKGIEVSAQARFGQLSADFGLGYVKSKLGSLTQVAAYQLPALVQTGVPQCIGNAGTAPPPTPCFDFNPYLVSQTGQQNPLSPELSGTADLNYSFRVGQDGTLTPKVTYSYVSKQYVSLFQIGYNEIPAHTLVGATLTYEAGPWQSELYVQNLTNEVYLVGNGGNSVFYGAPRQYGIRVKRDFR